MTERTRLPWQELLGLALVRLHWSPEVFWQATPRDLLAAVSCLERLQSAGGAAVSRADLAVLHSLLKGQNDDGSLNAAAADAGAA